MSAKKEAFIRVPCRCPICDRDAKHRYVKSKLFQPARVEDDQHVIEYKWESPRFEGIRPNFYHIWHCPQCHFCDEKEVFRGKDDSGGKLELIREKILILSKASGSLLTRLGQTIDMTQEYVTLESALCAHLQAIFIQEMLSPNMRQYAKLGRFYLRTAWLYREKAAWNIPEVGVPEGVESYRAFFESLREEWPEIPLDEPAALAQAVDNYKKDLDHSKRVDDVRHEVGVMFLLVDLQQRLDRLDDALAHVRHIFQLATSKRQGTRQALDGGISRGKLNTQQIESMRSLINWLNNAIERATTTSETINNKIFQQEYPRAREVVMQLGAPTIKEVVTRLKADGFHDVTCRRIAALFRKKVLADHAEADAAEAAEVQADASAEEEKKSGGFFNKILKGIRKDEPS